MKAGILTFVNTINYGASLQALALQRVIERYGVEAEVLQYTNEKIEQAEKNKGKISLKRILKSISMGAGIKRKTTAFEKYEAERLHKGQAVTKDTVDELNLVYDYFVAGSDQIWNTKLTYGDMNYFLSFVSDDNKKISYAPSFGNTACNESLYTSIADNLKKIHHLSVREQSGADFIKKVSGREAEVVLDPTLLLNKSEWLTETTFTPSLQHYILVYFPHNKKKVFEFVKVLKKKTGLPVVYLSISPRKQAGVKTIYDASPNEFLGWINNADYVVTGSFHGTVFSLNMEKQFFYEPSGEGSRIDNIVRITGTLNRSIDNPEVMENRIDYSEVTPKLDHERTSSLDWLKRAMER